MKLRNCLLITFFFLSFLTALSELRYQSAIKLDTLDGYRDALRWRAPLHSGDFSISKIIEIADSDLSPGKSLRLSALRAGKEGLISSHSFLYDDSQMLSSLTEQIEVITGKRIVSELYPPEVNFKKQIIGQVLFWGWIGFACLTVSKGLNLEGKIINNPFVFYLMTSLLLAILWGVNL